MIDYIKGELVSLSPTEATVDTQHFGYKVQITLNTHETIKGKKDIKLFTHLNVRNEGQNVSGFELFGFSTEIERQYFSIVISVSGIGTATARLMLSSLQPAEISRAIALEDVQTITGVKGIGPKTAKRMILELKDKLPSTHESGELSVTKTTSKGNSIANEALSALTMLGFSKIQAQKAINQVVKQGDVSTVEELVKLCLKKL